MLLRLNNYNRILRIQLDSFQGTEGHENLTHTARTGMAGQGLHRTEHSEFFLLS